MTKIVAGLIWLLVVLLAGCSNIDQFSARVSTSNVNSQTALDEETLLNIERAARFQPLTFVAITKTTGQRTGDFKLGLPTATLGGGQTIAQHQTAFPGSTLDNSMQGTWESNPLITSAFQQGMMTPVSPKQVALLLGEYPRELVFYAVLDGIEFRGGKDAWYFRNDPGLNAYRGLRFNEECRSLEAVDQHGATHTIAARRLGLDRNRDCNFSEFTYLLEYALAVGLTADIAPAASTSTPKSSSKDSSAPSAPSSVGIICFDPALSLPELRSDAEAMHYPCDPKAQAHAPTKFNFGDTDYDISFRFRSPMGIYAFLGKVIRDHAEPNIIFKDHELNNGGPLIAIREGFSDCLLVAGSVNESFCVPRDQSEDTLAMIGMLEQLRNLNIAPTDLNASFSVHISD